MARSLIIIGGVAVAALACLVHPQPASAQAGCVAGARVAAASYGHWYRATVKGPANGGSCLVHFDRFSSSSDEAVTRDNIGPIALADQYDHPAAPVPARPQALAPAGRGGASAPRLVATGYSCSSFVGPVTGGGHMVPMPGITILPGGRYRHANGGGGTVTASNGVVEFHGGPLNGQAATYDAGPDGRRGNLHLFNERRSRTVIDCDGHG